jgi:FAD/FMN-containing dehydrogenase/Fe-S oxidoreductase
MSSTTKPFIKDKPIDLNQSSTYRRIYATDASIYRQLPYGVAIPKTVDDIKSILDYCHKNNLSIVPRGAGTSLAGQSIGKGIVVDLSKHFNKILHLDQKKKQVTVLPGVVRDELNHYLNDYDLFFGPNTSTSNRCNLGGMLGNNSCGTTSIKYGVTRDKVISVKALLSDGSEVDFQALSNDEIALKMTLDSHEGQIYRGIIELLSDKKLKEAVDINYPKATIHRRNNGYALDYLLQTSYFDKNSDKPFNLAPFICGSEGTLAIATEITLALNDKPPEHQAMLLAHFSSITDCLKAVKPAMQHDLYTCEMMDKTILDCTKDQLKYQQNRAYIHGEPEALLMLECRATSKNELHHNIESLENKLINKTNAYAYPLLKKDDIPLVFELRKAGLGLLSLVKGDKKPVACVEDTAVALDDFADYIEEFSATMQKYNKQAVYYAHAGAGELHIRPKVDLKNHEDVNNMAALAHDITLLVKKYNGSISGEHGDGQLRASFLPLLLGDICYQALKKVKHIFDPHDILNPGKIVDAPEMTEHLRYESYRSVHQGPTLQKFSPDMLSEAEKCNGSGDCRKSPAFGGVMCPSFQVTKNENESTRARANALREYLSDQTSIDHLHLDDVLSIFKNCVSCKACVNECPSSVDAASFKSELLYQYHKSNGFKLSAFLIANNYYLNKAFFWLRGLINPLQKNQFTGGILKSALGFHHKRQLPELAKNRFQKWLKSFQLKQNQLAKNIYLFADEFTDLYGFDIGQSAVEILNKLGFQVNFIHHAPSGRAEISKGFLEKAKQHASKNVAVFADLISADTPLIGIEPSAVLSFRDDYKRLVDDSEKAEKVAQNTYLFEEFIAGLIDKDQISQDSFTDDDKDIKIHVHCHQKALSSSKVSFDILNFPKNYKAKIIVSSCCGMAGSYGLEKSNYEMSMKMGEQQLFPAVRKAPNDTLIAANGFSCRHQIKDGTNKTALHPIEIFRHAMK